MIDKQTKPGEWFEPHLAFPNGIHTGMTLRDYFASKSMQGFLGRPNLPVIVSDDELAAACYEMADAMLKARNK